MMIRLSQQDSDYHDNVSLIRLTRFYGVNDVIVCFRYADTHNIRQISHGYQETEKILYGNHNATKAEFR